MREGNEVMAERLSILILFAAGMLLLACPVIARRADIPLSRGLAVSAGMTGILLMCLAPVIVRKVLGGKANPS